MPNRPHPALRTSLSRLAIAGAATLASLVTITPAAIAADQPANEPTSGPSDSTRTVDEPTPPATEEQAPVEEQVDPPAPEKPDTEAPDDPAPEDEAPDESAPVPEDSPAQDEVTDEDTSESDEGVAADEVEPDFGFQKFRVGVKLKTGAYVPEDATVVGSEFSYTFTDENGEDVGGGTCVATVVEGDTAYCEAPDTGVLERKTAASLLVTPGDPSGPNFTAPPGTTVTISQTSAPADVVLDPYVSTLYPCDNTDPFPCDTSAVIFEDTGAAPVASRDDVDTDVDAPVTIDVLANDENLDDPATTVTAGVPSHGTATVVVQDGRQQILYTPNAGYNGRERFNYTITNGNGSSTGTIRVDVGEVAPDYGSRKYRVGVQIADGSYVQDGVTTTGSTFTITTTDVDGNVLTPVTCTTGAASGPPARSSSCGTFYSLPGSTVTVVQASAPAGLVKSDVTRTLGPCDNNEDECEDDPLFGTALQFFDTGLRPVARDDSDTTDQGEKVRVDVLANDDSDDPNTSLKIASRPGDGKAKVVGRADAPANSRVKAVPSAGTLAIDYTPDAGFSGEDTFDYTLTNSNGTSTGTVTIDVVADDAGVDDDNASTGSGDDDALLPDTGGADVRLLGLGGLLVAGGGLLTARGRRRRHGAHAR